MKTNMHQGVPNRLFGYAQLLRSNPTKAEEKLWGKLRGNQTGYKFRRQHPFINYVVDFYCHALKLIIEVDGEIHKERYKQIEDQDKDEIFKANGFCIERFTNTEVLCHIDEVIDQIQNRINLRTEELRLNSDEV